MLKDFNPKYQYIHNIHFTTISLLYLIYSSIYPPYPCINASYFLMHLKFSCSYHYSFSKYFNMYIIWLEFNICFAQILSVSFADLGETWNAIISENCSLMPLPTPSLTIFLSNNHCLGIFQAQISFWLL